MVASAVLSDCMIRGEATWQRWLPVALTIFVSACAVIFSQALHSQEHAERTRQAAAEATGCATRCTQQMAAMEAGLERMRARYESGAVDTQRAWEADAQEHLRGSTASSTSLVVAEADRLAAVGRAGGRWQDHLRSTEALGSPERRAAIDTCHRHARAGGVLAALTCRPRTAATRRCSACAARTAASLACSPPRTASRRCCPHHAGIAVRGAGDLQGDLQVHSHRRCTSRAGSSSRHRDDDITCRAGPGSRCRSRRRPRCSRDQLSGLPAWCSCSACCWPGRRRRPRASTP